MSLSVRRQVSTHRAPTSVYEEDAMLKLALEISAAEASAASHGPFCAPPPSAPPRPQDWAGPSTSQAQGLETSASFGQQASSSRAWGHPSIEEDARLARELQAAEEAAARASADERFARELLEAEQRSASHNTANLSCVSEADRVAREPDAAQLTEANVAGTSARMPEAVSASSYAPCTSSSSCSMSEDERLARELYAAEQNAVSARLLEDERLARQIYAAEQNAVQASRQPSSNAAQNATTSAPPAAQPTPWNGCPTSEVHLWPQEAHQLLGGKQQGAIGYPTTPEKSQDQENHSTAFFLPAPPSTAHNKPPLLSLSAPLQPAHERPPGAPAWNDSAHNALSQPFLDSSLPAPPSSDALGSPDALVPGVWHDPTQDAELARKLQNAENVSFKNRLKSVGGSANVCAGCNKPIASLRNFLLGSSGFVAVGSRRYHPDCAKCAACGGKLRAEVAIGPDGKLYHRSCAHEKHALKCDACKHRIPSQGHSTRYLTRPFWKERYCPAHESDGTPCCCSCTRFRSDASDDLVHFDDGRHLCLMCLETMLPDTQAAQPLYDEVLAFFAHYSMKHPEKPPMMLVEDSALNEYSAKERGIAEGPMTHTRGVTLTEHYRTIRVASISRRGLFGLSSKVDHVPLKRSTVVHVQAILVLAGLPRIVTGAILAHEAMHAWFAMNKYIGLPIQVEEGMCQLMAYLWVEQQQTEGTEAQLASFVAHQIRTDRSAVYGDGFRAALAAFQEHGLVETLRWLKESRTFPPCMSSTQNLGQHLADDAASRWE